MANTYTQIYVHVVFAVKYRQNLIQKQWQDELYKYICGTVNGKKQKVYAIGGVADRIHILLSLRPDKSLSEIVKDIKANSSKWINERNLLPGKFQWQGGFGAFSYAHSQLDTIIHYINNQEEHHNQTKFKDEYHEMLQKFNIDFDDNYLFDWVE